MWSSPARWSFRCLEFFAVAALLVVLAGAAHSEDTGLHFSNARIETAYPGDWTEIDLRIVNSSERERNCEVEIQCGDLDTGVHACAFPFSLPAKTDRQRTFPVLLPALLDREPKTAAPESSTASASRPPANSPPGRPPFF